jgi:DNA mismatch repair protein MutL
MIRILPEVLSNQIAAGEVVERPASVVKELVENALDAGGKRIIVEIEKGGRSLIQVSDNGEGMGHDDALLAIERYATSKIADKDDLFSIRTLGFRGEALPSIAAVSSFVLETRNGREPEGTRIEITGGRLKNVSRIGAPQGTLAAVKGLFFNTPARRKFLKTVNTEMGHIADTVASIALGWPDVGFRLNHNGKTVKHWTPATDPALRAADVLGREAGTDLYPVSMENGPVSLAGWIASPRMTRSTSRSIYIYVNGRYVRDRLVQHALFSGYAGRLMKGQFPMGALFLRVAPDTVDVNVHPAKAEVRFVDGNRVHDLVAAAVRRTLEEMDRPRPAAVAKPDPPKETPASESSTQTDPPPTESRVAETSHRFPESPDRDSEPATRRPPLATPDPPPAARSRPKEQPPLWEEKGFGSLRPVGQVLATYIVCESEEGIVLVDQHAAHERVLFETLRKGGSGSQALLVPETVELSYTEADLLEGLIPSLEKMGLEIEPFGGQTFVVRSVPAMLRNRDVRPLIRGIVEEMAEMGQTLGSEEGLRKALDASISVMACHGAIRAHQTLSDKQMQGLMEQLERCENPSHCPHGRPTWIRWSRQFLEKSFHRIV